MHSAPRLIVAAVTLATTLILSSQALAEPLPFNPKQFKSPRVPRITGPVAGSLPATAPVNEVNSDEAKLVLEDFTSGAETGVSTLATNRLQRYVIGTTSGWITLRGRSASFTVALGRNTWGIDVALDHAGTSEYWYYGYVKGGTSTGGTYGGTTVERCLWAGTEPLDPSTQTVQTQDCTNVNDLNESSYMFAFNDNLDPPDPDANCNVDSTGHRFCDGTPTFIDPAKCPAGAPVMGNVQPWRPLLGLWGDYLGYTVLPGQWVKWRMITKDLQFTLVRDAYRSSPSYPGGYARPAGTPKQDWGFVPTTCITTWGTHVRGPRN